MIGLSEGARVERAKRKGMFFSVGERERPAGTAREGWTLMWRGMHREGKGSGKGLPREAAETGKHTARIWVRAAHQWPLTIPTTEVGNTQGKS